ncbi:hypothetical protein UFOVP1233_37 [uncultured Caudovirales phage]|uniref:Uncharacterized protein n=1 Tax=uncultured Caudovirales phage TaxID=2100421 RepID=A0A6J5R9K6_9CAUD|nr:hypothetical protein UFOVP1233_37 [uncultured Caudovirales phage]
MPKRQRKVKVVWRPLGKEQAWGQATVPGDPQHPMIEVDPRLSAKRELEVVCHEALHIALPDLVEKEVDRVGKAIARVLWSQNFRRVVQGKHTTPVRISK